MSIYDKQNHWRRRRRFLRQPAVPTGDPNERALRRRCAAYLRRLVSVPVPLDRELLEFAGILLGPAVEPLNAAILDHLEEPDRGHYEQEFEECRYRPDVWPHEAAEALGHCDRRAAAEVLRLLPELAAALERELAGGPRSDFEQRAARFQKMLALSEPERELAILLFVAGTFPPAEAYIVGHLQCQLYANRRYLQALLGGISTPALAATLEGTLRRLELIELERGFSLSRDFLNLFHQPTLNLATGGLFARLPRPSLALERHLVPDGTVAHLARLLARRPEHPAHVLLYGAPGTGKTSFARALARHLRVPAYAVTADAENNPAKRRAAIQACLNLTSQGEGSLVVVDEADDLLNTQSMFGMMREPRSKAWLCELMEAPGARMIWIVNSIEGIDESVRRRFAFSVPFLPLNRAQRVQVWESVLRANRARRAFAPAEIARLAARYPCAAGPVDLAVKQARAAAPTGSPAFREAVRAALDAHHLLTHGVPPADADTVEPNYTLDALNLDTDLPALVATASAFSERLRAGGASGPVRNLNLLFHGPPGTGKSELARHLAERLGRELHVKQGAELLNCYVGETEKNIRLAFCQAEQAGAVLVIDEADTFLFPRAGATRSWEISFTNAFLTTMERYRGILVCTTNRLTGLDEASIRRFQLKAGFDWLTPDGAVLLFGRLLGPLAARALDPAAEAALRALRRLAPGDFRVVRDRFALRPRADVTPGALVAALAEETRLKPGQEARRIGF